MTLAVEPCSMDFNASNIPSISTLVGCCHGLIIVDKETSTVRLIHFTLQEYLSGHPDIFSSPQSAMAEICLTYLNSEQVKALSGDPSPDIRNLPLFELLFFKLGGPLEKGILGLFQVACT